MARLQHAHLQGRDDFFRLLGVLLPLARDRARQAPNFKPFVSIVRQLEAIEEWTENARDPSKDERKSINVGRVISREIETETADEDKYYDQLGELVFYFKHWLDDQEWLALDDSDVATFLPDG
jgi:hypothetical protein